MEKKTGRFKSIFGYQDLTRNTSPFVTMLIFMIPLLISGFVNNGMSLVNSIVLKNTVGGDSVTAINQTSPLSGCADLPCRTVSDHNGRERPGTYFQRGCDRFHRIDFLGAADPLRRQGCKALRSCIIHSRRISDRGIDPDSRLADVRTP